MISYEKSFSVLKDRSGISELIKILLQFWMEKCSPNVKLTDRKCNDSPY